MEHKVKVGEKEYTFKRPVLALEKEVQKVFGELIALPVDSEEWQSVWAKSVELMFQDPDAELLDSQTKTRGEMADVFFSFFGEGMKMQTKLPAG